MRRRVGAAAAFSARDFLAAARRHGATEFNAIGAMLEILMRRPVEPDDADTDLRLCYTGPSPDRERQEAFEARFGLRVVCGYAMSESAVRVDLAARDAAIRRAGHAYVSIPTLGEINEARVVDDAGVDLGVGVTGELLLRNPVVTPGYWEMPEETAAAIVDGWLHTGDLVTVERRGHLHVRGTQEGGAAAPRREPSPAEVEDAVLTRIPSVARVCGRRGPVRALRGGDQGVRGDCAGRAASTSRSCASGRRLRLQRVQGAALLAADRRLAAYPDRAGGQAPAARRPPGQRSTTPSVPATPT